ncbi:DUF456 domain-containing protein [Haloarchaeobius litoreus]|uniref:DUF456 domain-containing protein n=1 Tax=Haloarchaeobius litoreus TaxID=755306 RepID=A0ABD6DGB4_9EURY|nr:DUF456 domain-containing protein [Haloarchaeobius litoreus]
MDFQALLTGVDPVLVVALVLLVAGIVGSAVPSMPGPLLSVAGVLVFWLWGEGLGTVVAVGLVAVGLFAVVADLLADAVSARVGGASWQTTALAGVVGLALLFVTGPLGILVGVVGTVFALEYWETQDHRHAARAAVTTSLGILASAVVQVLLTLSMLLGFGLSVFVW